MHKQSIWKAAAATGANKRRVIWHNVQIVQFAAAAAAAAAAIGVHEWFK